MKLYYEESGVTLWHGHVLDVLRSMPDESVHCCVTSPPYWGLRDYGTAEWSGGSADCDHTYNHGVQGATGDRASRTFTGQAMYKGACGKCGAARVDQQIGLEATPEEFVAKMVEVFSEVRRVLRKDGTCWVNLGDSYATGAGKACSPGGGKQGDDFAGPRGYRGNRDDSAKHASGSIPQFQPNRMPITGLKPKDLVGIPWRVAFALQADGWWLRQDIIWHKPNPMPESVTDRCTKSHEYIFLLSKQERYYYDLDAIREPSESSDPRVARDSRTFAGRVQRNDDIEKFGTTRGRTNQPCCHAGGRNKRDVWTVNSQPFPEAHFATFPPDLIRPCILAGCPAGGTVLDPFSGAATTSLVAKENGRLSVGIELNEEYLEISKRRLSQEVLAF